MSENPTTSLVVETVGVLDVSAHPRNPRVGNPTAIAQSLSENDQYKPIVVQKSSGFVLAGNHTLLAARQLGWTHIQAVVLDVDDDRALKILLADNKTSDDSGYDDALLMSILEDIPDLTGTGYDLADLELLQFDATAAAPIALPRNVERKSDADVDARFDNLVWGYVQFGNRRVVLTPIEVERLNVIHDAFVAREDTDAGFGHMLADGGDADLGIESETAATDRLSERELKEETKQAKRKARASDRDEASEAAGNADRDGDWSADDVIDEDAP